MSCRKSCTSVSNSTSQPPVIYTSPIFEELSWERKNALCSTNARIANLSNHLDIVEADSGAKGVLCSASRAFLLFVRAILDGSGIRELVGDHHRPIRRSGIW